jgi:hypothetical protein
VVRTIHSKEDLAGQMAFAAEVAENEPVQKIFDVDFPSVKAEDSESEPSTEFASDGSASECSEEDCGSSFLTPFSSEETLLIFDWDDTLLPTTWIEKQGLRLDGPMLTEDQEQELQCMAEQAKETLQAAKLLGEVILVTNAEHGWVELSCQKFMPGLCDSLQDVRIFSARSAYEHRGVAQPSEWKYLAFQHELARFCDKEQLSASGEADALEATARRRNVISIGDSPHEREALIRVTAHMPDSCVKAVKLMARPEVQQLCQEHQLIGGCFADLVNHEGNLDLAFDCP